MSDCLFCKIIAGEIPSTKIYEDDNVFAFLDIAPVNPGHTLVIPKEHTPNIYEMSEKTLGYVMGVVKKLSSATKDALQADGINLEMNNDTVAGQVIFHAHLHVIPRFEGDGLKQWPGKSYEGSHQEEVAKKIKEKLR